MEALWIYEVRAWSASRNQYLAARVMLTDGEYAHQEAREFAEQNAENQLRHAEGFGPNSLIERMGWHQMPSAPASGEE